MQRCRTDGGHGTVGVDGVSAVADGEDEDDGDPAPAAANAPPHDGRPRPDVDDVALLGAMRAGSEAAYVAFYERHAPMLRRLARRLRAGDAATAELAEDVLSDAAERVRRDGDFAPLRLPAYLASALVRRVADAERRAHRHRALEARASDDVAGSAERVLRDVVSEYAVRASGGPAADRDALRLAPALARLAAALGAACTPDERVLLRLLADRVPQPDVARELGLTYGAARARIHRFRKRVWRWAAAYVAALPPHERAEVRRFLRRAGGPAAILADHPELPRARRAAPPPETVP